MKKSYIKLYIVEFIMLIAIILNNFVLNTDGKIIIFLSLIFGGLLYLMGFEKDKQINKTDVIQIVIIYSTTYLILTYIIGFFTGFFKNSYNLEFLSIIKNIVPVLIIIALEEMIRYIILNKGSRNKKIVIISFIIFTILDILLNSSGYDFSSFDSGLKLISLVILPNISKNILLTYLSLEIGYMPVLIYRIIFELTKYILPIFPNFGYYIQSILDITFPIVLFLKMNKLLKKKKITTITNKRVDRIITSMILVILLLMIYLVSNKFKYSIIAIGSNSMYPNIKIGDSVFVEKVNVNDISKLEVGQVLVYNYNNKIIVHRISAINYKKGGYIFSTKGDNNESEDQYELEQKDVIGIVRFKIAYIGSPSVWLNELLNG